MKSIPFSKFKLMKADTLRNTKSFQVTADGELLFIAVIPHGETLIRNHIINVVAEAVLINNNYGRDEVS